MNFFDLAVIIVFLITLLIGVSRGFVKTAMTLGAIAVICALVYFAGEPFGNLLHSSGLGKIIQDAFTGLFNKIQGFESAVIIDIDGVLMIEGTDMTVQAFLESGGIPGFLYGIINPFLVVGVTISAGLATGASKYCTLAIGALIIAVVVFVVFAILRRILNKALKFSGLKAIDRVIGGALYGVVGVFIIFVCLTVIDLMSGLSWMQPVVEYRDSSLLGKFLHENNLIIKLFNAIFVKS